MFWKYRHSQCTSQSGIPSALNHELIFKNGRRRRCGPDQTMITPTQFLEWLRNYWRGNVSREFLLGFCVPVGLLLLVMGTALSVWLFPGSYDWRYQVMCSLASPAKNPDGHLYWCLGFALSNIIGLPTCGYFARWFSTSSPRISFFSCHTLRTGYAAGVLLGLESAFFPNYGNYIHKAHEMTAIVTFACIYLGVAGFWYCLAVWLTKTRRCPKWVGVGVFLIFSVPMTGIMLSQAWLFFDPNRPGWVSREWIALGIPLWLSFAFWEWLAFCGLVFCICVLAVVLPSQRDELDEQEGRRRPARLTF